MLMYIFPSQADAEVADARIVAEAYARDRKEGGISLRTKRYAIPLVGEDGRAAIPADGGGIPTEAMRRAGVVALPEPVQVSRDDVLHDRVKRIEREMRERRVAQEAPKVGR